MLCICEIINEYSNYVFCLKVDYNLKIDYVSCYFKSNRHVNTLIRNIILILVMCSRKSIKIKIDNETFFKI